MNQLVSTEWLGKNLEKVKILDASWHLPNANRNSFEEYKAGHITNSIFFDIDKNSNQKTNLPHMLPSKDCLLYTSPSPRDRTRSRMPSSA